jgi:hypothetical protein
VEYHYWEKLNKAKDDLSDSVITQAEYDSLVDKAKVEFDGV